MVAAPDGSDIRRIGMDQRYAGKLTPFYAVQAMVLLFGSHYILRYDLAADTIGPVLEQPRRFLFTCAGFDGREDGVDRYCRRAVARRYFGRTVTPVETARYPNITAMVADGDRLWVGSAKGLYLLDGSGSVLFNQFDGAGSQ